MLSPGNDSWCTFLYFFINKKVLSSNVGVSDMSVTYAKRFQNLLSHIDTFLGEIQIHHRSLKIIVGIWTSYHAIFEIPPTPKKRNPTTAADRKLSRD